MTLDKSTFTLTDKGSAAKKSLMMGAIFTLATAIGWFLDPKHFYQSYLVAYTFWLTLALGGLFFTLASHLFGAVWSVAIRRFSEAAMYSFPLLALFFVPLLFGMHDLYHWTHADAVASDPILQAKSGYLNTTFFIIRAAVYFLIWFGISRLFYSLSLKQDKEPSDEIIEKMRRYSAPAMILFALSSTFAAFDWIMSLEPHWFSTIYGVYFFAGSFLFILVFVILIGQNIRKKGVLVDVFTIEHYHDLAKIIFSFTVFWAYIGGSQYFIIWYANIPEETVYYLTRWENGWNLFTMTLVFGHFILPFFALLFRASKRNLPWLKIVSIWIVIMHAIDMVWLILPALAHGEGPHFSWILPVSFFGIGGLFLWNFWTNFTKHPLIPVGERRLKDSIKFTV